MAAAFLDAGGAGFLLLLPDGTVAPAAELAGLLAGQGPAPGPRPAIGEALGLGPEQASHFAKWLDLVKQRHRTLRWEKLAPLAPVLETAIGNGEEEIHALLSYRKLLDGRGELAAIVVIAADPLPGRALERKLEEERRGHLLETRDVLALAANPPETAGAFLVDAKARLEAARKDWDAWLAGSDRAGGNPAGLRDGGGDSPGRKLFRELHMIKGNAGAFGFENLAAGAQEAEDLLEGLKRTGASTDRDANRLARALGALQSRFEELQRAMRVIAGEGQEAMARILRWKLERVVAAAGGIEAERLEPPLRNLVESTRRLAFLSPAYLARKYRNLVERLAHSLGKQVAFRVASNTGDIHPESFARVDEALVHILRNMVDHGIETPEERKASGKGEAEIELEYVAQDDRVFLRLRDDGRGMDPEAIASRGIELGILTRAEADRLDEVGKLGIIFMEGFTTRREAGMVSGRGLGLALAARNVSDRGGNIYVFSRPREGARFAIELPHPGRKRLPQ